MSKRPDSTEPKVWQWTILLVLSGSFLVGFGVWQVLQGNVRNGVGIIVVPAVVAILLLILIFRRRT
jgi:hypothetical protein